MFSSLAGTVAVPGSAAYTTAQHALIGLTRSLAVDFGPVGVRAGVMCPGPTRTGMFDQVGARPVRACPSSSAVRCRWRVGVFDSHEQGAAPLGARSHALYQAQQHQRDGREYADRVRGG
ncbi:SDR family oxidoreductase [Streptomyces adelaidensis]|uniref:SDR family oxidoreductase n=1 Tax=Streptomyces adelaidensis TaxID=2796465 RepID=UPI00190482AF|nr:SDR family oxidoreductase [Streptomyces adelaidensis]